MRCVAPALLFLYAAQVQADVEEAVIDHSKMVDMLAERGCREGSSIHADLDESTLGKSSQISSVVKAAPPGLRVSPMMPAACERQSFRLAAKPYFKREKNPWRQARLTKEKEEDRAKWKPAAPWKPDDPFPKGKYPMEKPIKLAKHLELIGPLNVDKVAIRSLRGWKNEADLKIRKERFEEAKDGGNPQWFFFKTRGVRAKKLRFNIMNAGKVTKNWEGYEVSCSYDYKDWFTVPTEFTSRGNLLFEVSTDRTPTPATAENCLYCAYKVPKAAAR